MNRLNTMLYRDTKVSEFVTLFYGVLDTRNRRFTYCNAGHPPALLLRDGKIRELTTDNMVLGIDPNEKFRQEFIDLKPSDLLLLYTDGLADAMNFKEETFGNERIREAFLRGGASAETVTQSILWDVRKFVGMTHRTDDVTMIVARMT
jgi:phosphoserine phosphatase RsbU/P